MTLEEIYAMEPTLRRLEEDVLAIRQQGRSPGSQIWNRAICTQDRVKASGRGVRHKDDYCLTYLLGKLIERLVEDKQDLFPIYWMEAVDYV